MQSWLDGALARYDNDNEALLPRTCVLLGRIVDDPELHARLINTLSLLEHTGSRKIVATQHGPNIDQPTLRHIAEEAHHAFFMKRQAEKTAGGPLEYVDRDLLAPAAARMYFPRLEAAMLAVLPRERSARAAYLYMSMIVEFRALWFYRLYEQTLRRAGHPMSLKRILGEEHNHLHDVARRLQMAAELSDTRATQFAGHEIRLYSRLLDAMLQATRTAGKECA
jgi:NAD-dependent oxidoreductase involved in siderophore biosynthesis